MKSKMKRKLDRIAAKPRLNTTEGVISSPATREGGGLLATVVVHRLGAR